MSSDRRKPAPSSVLFPESLDPAQRLLFIGLAESDLMQASTAAEAALRLVGAPDWLPTDVYLALSECALIRYARPFMGNRMPGMKKKAALPLTYLPKNIKGAETFHNVAMALRHQFGAHSDMTKRHLWLERLGESRKGVGWQGNAFFRYLTPPQLHGLFRLARSMSVSLKRELSALADAEFGELPCGARVTISSAEALAFETR